MDNLTIAAQLNEEAKLLINYLEQGIDYNPALEEIKFITQGVQTELNDLQQWKSWRACCSYTGVSFTSRASTVARKRVAKAMLEAGHKPRSLGSENLPHYRLDIFQLTLKDHIIPDRILVAASPDKTRVKRIKFYLHDEECPITHAQGDEAKNTYLGSPVVRGQLNKMVDAVVAGYCFCHKLQSIDQFNRYKLIINPLMTKACNGLDFNQRKEYGLSDSGFKAVERMGMLGEVYEAFIPYYTVGKELLKDKQS